MFISKWYAEDTIEYVIAMTFAESKNRLFQMFFGWRQSHKDESRFLFTKRQWEIIDIEIKYYYQFVLKKTI